ncbi:uncharacterized protein LOC130732594 [Lotus japonicus]|uniref:uncharacterized protein LOC130732594 n=1 Tax=Lotus japonicus TaxID=34305 RepID=UPI00258BD87E|nr:uncharacterized protein LOC130732594 [Lotus japonicus]
MRSLVLETYEQADPKDHLLHFNVKMAMSAASDAVKCRMLPSTFQGAEMAWFVTLPQGSIAKFRDFSSKFLVQFSASKIEDLFDIRQRERETLKQYVKRYSAASAKFEESEPRTCVRAFKSGFSPGKLNCKLSRKPARSVTEVRARASAYILEEEDDTFTRKRVKAEKVHSRRDASLARKRIQGKETDNRRRVKEVEHFAEKFEGKQLCSRKENIERQRPRRITSPRWRGKPERCSNEELAKLLQLVEVTPAAENGENEIDSRQEEEGQAKWCEYHHLKGHDTSDYFVLKGEVERLIRVRRPRATDRESDRDQQNSRWRAPVAGKREMNAAGKKEVEEAFNDDVRTSIETINTIAEGFGGGDNTSTASRKRPQAVASVQEYPAQFGRQHPDTVISSTDFEGIETHREDPVVVMVRINGFNVQRVLLDQGSSADIIYGDEFEQLGLTDKDLMSYTGSLVGFAGEQVWVRGYLNLDTIFGVDENAKLLRVRYLVLQVVA